MAFPARKYGQVNQRAWSFDGATQYLSKSSPTGLDLNGSEMITTTDSRTFEGGVGEWIGGTTTTVAQSALASHGGTKSLLVTQVGAGTDTNCAKLNVGFGVLNLKYTKEVWALSVSGSTNLIIKFGGATKTTIINTSTWTKCVLNVLSVGAGSFPRVYADGDAVFYVDDVSLTQAYDAMMVQEVNFSILQTSVPLRVLSANFNLQGYAFIFRTTPSMDVDICDGILRVQSQGTNSGIWADSKNHIVIGTIDRTATGKIYLDGTALNANASIAGLGKIQAQAGDGLSIGANFGTSYCGGKIGESQIYIFQSGLPSNIAQIISQINSTWKRNGLPRSINGVLPAFWNNPKYGLLDLSGNGNNLTNNGGTYSQTFYP